MRTRFKMWWRLVGSAVEHAAAKAAGEPVDFQTLFLAQDEEDEDDNALVEALITLRTWAAARKKAADRLWLPRRKPTPQRPDRRRFW